MRPRRVQADGATILSYGPAGGYAPLRRWIADEHGVSQSRVVLTNGSLQGFSLLAQVLAGGGERVLVEAPTYDRPLRILGSLGAEVAPACDEGGLDVDALDADLRRGRRPAFLYVIPTFQNPTGRTLAAERRRRLVELAAEHDLLVFEDDPHGAIRFEGDAPPTLFDLDGGKHVAFASSFSKTVAPGIRVGYLVLPERLARPWSLRRPRPTSPRRYSQATVYEFVRRGHLERNVSSSARSSAPGGRPARRARRAPGRDGCALEPARGRLLPLARPPAVRTRGPSSTLHRGSASRSSRGRIFIVGRRRSELGPAGVQLRLPAQLREAVRRLAGLLFAAPAVDLRQQHAA